MGVDEVGGVGLDFLEFVALVEFLGNGEVFLGFFFGFGIKVGDVEIDFGALLVSLRVLGVVADGVGGGAKGLVEKGDDLLFLGLSLGGGGGVGKLAGLLQIVFGGGKVVGEGFFGLVE